MATKKTKKKTKKQAKTTIKHGLNSVTEIKLKASQAALVFNDDFSIELYVPAVEDSSQPANNATMLAVAVGTMTADEKLLMKAIDAIKFAADEIEKLDKNEKSS